MKYELWPSVLAQLQEILGESTIDRWFSNIIDAEQQQNTLYITVGSDMQADWMERNYSDAIKSAVLRLTGEEMFITFISNDKIKSTVGAENLNTYVKVPHLPTYYNARLNPRYTFETFIVGSGNRFAHAAAMAVADKPAQKFNPLFLYGGSGLGKTHLMHSIGHRIRARRPETNIIYVSTETFTNDFIASIRGNSRSSADAFNERYRNADILLIDDIQFLTGKEGIQEAFFHTFNSLFEQGKQIVISSDRPPKEIATLEERLRSRFEGGLLTDIQPPDLETRIAILQYKAEQDDIVIENDAITFIAENILSNIRELEGAFNRVKYYASLVDSNISLAMTKDVLQGILPNSQKKELTSDLIRQTVADYFHIKPEDMLSPRRDQSITRPRHIAMYLCQTVLNQSLVEIGKEFGGRDHTTVLHGCKKIAKDLETDYNLSRNIAEIKEIIKQ